MKELKATKLNLEETQEKGEKSDLVAATKC